MGPKISPKVCVKVTINVHGTKTFKREPRDAGAVAQIKAKEGGASQRAGHVASSAA